MRAELEEVSSSSKPIEKTRVVNRAGRERALVNAAGRLFAAKGYEATTTREIAAEAGCAEGLISRYFKGKAGLLRALVQQHFDEEVDEFQHTAPPAASMAEELRQLVTWEVEHIWEDRDFLRACIPQMLLNPEIEAQLEVGPERHFLLIRERLGKHSQFQALSPTDQEALVQLVAALGIEFGFLIPVRSEDFARSRGHAVAIAELVGRLFR